MNRIFSQDGEPRMHINVLVRRANGEEQVHQIVVPSAAPLHIPITNLQPGDSVQMPTGQWVHVGEGDRWMTLDSEKTDDPDNP